MNHHYQILLLTILMATVRVAAQSNGSVTYTAADGLANANYLTFLQDKQGYLWVGSYSNGVSRFDGQRWQYWDTRNRLYSNSVTQLFEDQAGRILFIHGDHESSCFFQDSFEKRPAAEGSSVFFDVFSKTLLRCNNRSGQLLRYNERSKIYEPYQEPLLPVEWMPRYSKIAVQWQPDSTRYLFMAWRTREDGADLLIAKPGSGTKPLMLAHLSKDQMSATAFMTGNGTILLADYGQRHFFKLRNGQFQPFSPPTLPGYQSTGPLDGIAIRADQATHTLLMVWQLQEKTGGRSRYLLADYDLNDLRLRKTLLFSTSFKVDHCFKDRAQTYWVSTNASVLRIFPEQFFIPTEAPGMIASAWAAAEAKDGHIWFSSYGFGLAEFDGLNVHASPANMDPKSFFDNGSLTDGLGNMYFNAENIRLGGQSLPGLLRFDGRLVQLLTPGTIGFFLAYDRRGRMMRGMHDLGLWILNKGKSGQDADDWFKIDQSKGLLLQNVLCAVEDRAGRYWMGRLSQGLACYDPRPDKVFNWLKTRDVPNYGVMSMDLDSRGNLWLGTDRGLCWLKTPDNVHDSLPLFEAIQRIGQEYTGETAVNSLKLYDAHTLLFGNAQGFYLLDLDGFYAQPQRIIIRVYNAKNGNALGGVEQNAAFFTRGKQVWLLGAQGALRFDPRLAWRDTLAPALQIDSLVTNLKTFSELTGVLGLGNGIQRVRIYYHPLVNPLLLDNIRFRYRLTGDSDWSALTEGLQMEFPRLAPGHYTFEIVAEKYGIRSASRLVTFRIWPVWWQNPLVWLAAVASIVGIAIFFRNKDRKIAGQRIQLEKTKTEMALMSKEKDKLQVQAIVNQLNPHFINNALQWLQVRVDEDEEAVRVVGKLSENIATVFKNSRQKKPFHGLQAELKLAENYLFIQKCRFRDRLHYDLPSETEIQEISEVNVPLMIVQIHVENAVEHGIRSKTDGTGRVQIELQHTADYVTITVTDDGVGRAAAAQIGSRGTQNGTLMLKELATIYNRQNEQPIEQHYQDGIFTGPEGKPYGTRVIIRIPKVYQFDI